MSDLSTMLSDVTLLGLATIVALCMITTFLIIERRKNAKTQLLLKQELQKLRKDMQAVSNGSIGVGKRLLEIQDIQRKIDSRFDSLQKKDPGRVTYSEAARLVTLGAEIEDLMNTCGISRPEAELVTALQNKPKAAANKPAPRAVA
ncbi:MAG: DUF2802 domain-containing protein [Pseudomonadales bacterium]|uniref:DNA repair ATPase n=1 Tax=Oleiphilus messinensis TaxID=141451 RepID=A0A1Y0I9R7_9GAMM|nr:DUF2802 domain-containing protein [Oleiphilus messinensis]ARU57267.1 DNA repair ATPase [Oleiphilus messinensis]MCG8613140.1 DUF2802 domain-containing protein [Pseudomonadales bacterium]